MKRQFVVVRGREVHARSAGRGPAVLLIHECPRSSATLVPLLEHLAAHGLHAFAIDLPGFGLSEPLPEALPTVQDLAAHVGATLDALGIERCAVYGMHTGAKVALELARLRPAVVASLVLDGLSMNPPDDRMQPGEGYLAGFRPRQDGAYLAELWCRERDQYRFYPWHERTSAARLPWPAPDPGTVHAHLVDLLLAGPEFGRTYLAPYRYSAAQAISQVAVPTAVVCREDDLLFAHLDRLPPLPVHCTVHRLPADAAAWRTGVTHEIVRFAPVGNDAPGTRDGVSDPIRRRRRFVRTATGLQTVHEFPSAARRVLMALPAFPGAASGAWPLLDALTLDARGLTVDLPGCGDAEPLPAATDIAAGTADRIRAVLDELSISRVTLLASDLSAPLALAFAERYPERLEQLVLDGEGLYAESDRCGAIAALPDLSPAIAGEHLLRAWHLLRDQSLAWPWFNRESSAVRRIAPALDADVLHRALVELMKGPADALAFWTAFWSADAAKAVPPAIRVARLVVSGDPAHRRTHSAGTEEISRGPAPEDLANAVSSLLRRSAA
jgi:pimeloyl-ACP methyl ester carboxylesterase